MLASAERYKTDIAGMGSSTEKLERLRPVTFKLKSDRLGTVQYGLIAEEVAKIYPELVIRDANGKVEGVRYEELAPMLLNEVQKDRAAIRTLSANQETYGLKFAAQEAEIRDLRKLLADVQAGLAERKSMDGVIARR